MYAIRSYYEESLGIKGHEKVRCAEIFEAMCNPVAQAEVLNEAGAEFNILLGLCVGHDSMFFKYATAPCTVLRITSYNVCYTKLLRARYAFISVKPSVFHIQIIALPPFTYVLLIGHVPRGAGAVQQGDLARNNFV